MKYLSYFFDKLTQITNYLNKYICHSEWWWNIISPIVWIFLTKVIWNICLHFYFHLIWFLLYVNKISFVGLISCRHFYSILYYYFILLFVHLGSI